MIKKLLQKIYDDLFYLYSSCISDEKFIRRRYYRKFGKLLNLDCPTLFTEKIQWLKLNDRTNLHTICADKYKVREFVENKIGREYLIPLVFATENVDDICLQKMPNYPVIIKTNHDSGGGIIIQNKQLANYNAIRRTLKKRLKKNYYVLRKEWEYKNIEKKIIVEKLMQDKTGNILLNDFKIYCFNGKPKYIQTLSDRESEIKETWYDTNWEKQEFWDKTELQKDIKKPESLDLMIEIAEKLSQDFIFVRIDLYDVFNKVYFGEITFHPYAGFMKWHPAEWDKKLGDLIILPQKND